MEIKFENLVGSDLVIDCIYKGGSVSNKSSEPLSKLFPKCGNSGGFRKAKREDSSGKLAYVILYTSMEETEWPDYLDKETGIFRYYGDNRKSGNRILNTKFKGNQLLEDVFNSLHSGIVKEEIPPFFVFKKTGNKYDVQFLGLAVPGNPNLSSDRDLISFWRTMQGKRFQNYEAYFTILNTKKESISKKWIIALVNDYSNNLKYAPEVWKKFIDSEGKIVKALIAPRIKSVPSRIDQLANNF